MANIPNTEYITVNANGIFVGGKPATTYRDQEICNIDYVKEVFALMQEQNPNITEFHIMSSETGGEFAKPGKPSSKPGASAWCRVVTRDKTPVSWVFALTYTSAAYCASYCAYDCASHVRDVAGFRAAVLGAVIDKQNSRQKQNALINALKDTDLSKFIGIHTIGAYEIVIRNKQNTRG